MDKTLAEKFIKRAQEAYPDPVYEDWVDGDDDIPDYEDQMYRARICRQAYTKGVEDVFDSLHNMTDEEADRLVQDYINFLAKGLTEKGVGHNIGREWMKEHCICPNLMSLEKMRGWIARDSYSDPINGLGLNIHSEKPTRRGNVEWSANTIYAHLPWEMFPEVTFMDEPVEIEILIRKI